MRDQFGILPKKRMIGYSKPYPNDYDLIPLPPKYRLPDFTKFSGSEGTSSIEHVSRYLAQLGMVSASDELRVRFFSQSLTGPTFGWYTSLLPDSIRTWKQLEEQFHVQYHSEAKKAGIADLTQVRQREERRYPSTSRGSGPSGTDVIRFAYLRRAVELAIAGLSAPLKDVTFQADYNSLAHMVQRLTSYEQRHPELYQDKFKRVALIEMEEDDDSVGDQEVAVAEWTRGQSPCPASLVKENDLKTNVTIGQGFNCSVIRTWGWISSRMVSRSKQQGARIEPGGVRQPLHVKLLGSKKGFAGPAEPSWCIDSLCDPIYGPSLPSSSPSPWALLSAASSSVLPGRQGGPSLSSSSSSAVVVAGRVAEVPAKAPLAAARRREVLLLLFFLLHLLGGGEIAPERSSSLSSSDSPSARKRRSLPVGRGLVILGPDGEVVAGLVPVLDGAANVGRVGLHRVPLRSRLPERGGLDGKA
ncbi:hypothetical protein QYE76_063366 [Lolium multiflorum]|uniref:Retrotransposon gag domain-containing protein n=1 Tax=Lolium multiflorum TaxID=4521 RepID=A0AAD8S4E9_LOLMU|nr:hypothetical protein QYE76_063366 [Lolium multiflorum]